MPGHLSLRSNIVRIAASRFVRLPESLIDEARLGEEVQLRVVAAGILIERASPPRAGWAKAADRLRRRGEDGLLDEPLATDFDRTEWDWA